MSKIQTQTPQSGMVINNREMETTVRIPLALLRNYDIHEEQTTCGEGVGLVEGITDHEFVDESRKTGHECQGTRIAITIDGPTNEALMDAIKEKV